MDGDTKAGVVDTLWRTYAERVVPANASTAQRLECRRAFFAGAAGLFGQIMNNLDEGEEPTDADFARLDAIQAELEQFNSEVLAGKA
ncbi:MAG: hypothetical protein ACREEN_01680 [Stellaceae bacterium]